MQCFLSFRLIQFHVKKIMARSISQTLIRTATTAAKADTHSSLLSAIKPAGSASRLLSFRNKYDVREVGPHDNTTATTNNNAGDVVDVEAVAVQKIEDAIHRIIVLKSVPDWLPLVPGGSYWVPPKRRVDGLPQLVHTVANALTEEEYLALTNVREVETSSSNTPPTPMMTGITHSEDDQEESEDEGS